MSTLAAADPVARARDPRRGLDVESLKESFLNHVAFTQVKVPGHATKRDLCMALAMAVRDRLIERWIATRRAYYNRTDTKRVYYLSLEFLIGRTLGNSMVNLQLYDECYQALSELGYDLEEIRDLEEEAGLGNGGLGRLAACFLDSMATLELPGYGYGIRYDYGMFHQRIQDGQQVEQPDDWLRLGNPWQIARPEHTLRVQFYGRVEAYVDEAGEKRRRWVDTYDVLALPYDIPVPGYHNNTVNTLRLFSAKAPTELDLSYFNHGDYLRACTDKSRAENITKVLYPKDDSLQGRELRLQQEYLLVSASLQEILERFRRQHEDWRLLPERAAIQLNDTHPALAVAELMRLLVDREGLTWDAAWAVTVPTFAYTNHTVLSEALEKWSTSLLGRLLPRHLEIIYEINHRFLQEVAKRYPNDHARRGRMSMIEDGRGAQGAHGAPGDCRESFGQRGFRPAHPDPDRACAARFPRVLPDALQQQDQRHHAAPLAEEGELTPAFLITDVIGDGWVKDLSQLRRLAHLVDDHEFLERWRETKRLNKERFTAYLRREQGQRLNPDTMFDCQVKRIHEYKRQLLNLLHVVTLYGRFKAGAVSEPVPRTVLLAGKAAPGYHQAKLTIRLANAISAVVNSDPEMKDKLAVHFLANYNVSLAEQIIPAAELSEQISTAGMEASGTGNMKFALNGALTIGTLDGANVEIKEEVGDDNIFIFGLTAGASRSCGRAAMIPGSTTTGARSCAGRSRRSAATFSHLPSLGSSSRWWTACCCTATPTSCWPTTSPTSSARSRWTPPTATRNIGPGCH